MQGMQSPIMVMSACPSAAIEPVCPFPACGRRDGFRISQPLLTRDPPHPDPSDTNTKRETGRTAQLNNIAAAKVRERAHRKTRESDPSVILVKLFLPRASARSGHTVPHLRAR